MSNRSRNPGSGSDNVFEELLIEHLNPLYAYALRLTGDAHRAEDLVQEASLTAFKKLDSLRDADRFKTWVFRILRNLFINQLPKRRPISLDEADEEYLRDRGEEVVVTHVAAGELRRALDALPIHFREVVWLAHVEGFSHREIGEILNCPIGTVASRLYRGRALLRRKIGLREREAPEKGRS